MALCDGGGSRPKACACLLLASLGAQVPIPKHMDLYLLREEAEPTDRTALEAVVDHIKEEMARLNVRDA